MLAAEVLWGSPSSVSHAVVRFSMAWAGPVSWVVLDEHLWRCWQFQTYADVHADALEGLSGLGLRFDPGVGIGVAEAEAVTEDAVEVDVAAEVEIE